MTSPIKDAMSSLLRSTSSDLVLGVGTGRALGETITAARLVGMTEDEIADAISEGSAA